MPWPLKVWAYSIYITIKCWYETFMLKLKDHKNTLTLHNQKPSVCTLGWWQQMWQLLFLVPTLPPHSAKKDQSHGLCVPGRINKLYHMTDQCLPLGQTWVYLLSQRHLCHWTAQQQSPLAMDGTQTLWCRHLSHQVAMLQKWQRMQQRHEESSWFFPFAYQCVSFVSMVTLVPTYSLFLFICQL